MENQMDKEKYTHIGVRVSTKVKINFLATLFNMRIYNLIERWVEKEWNIQCQAGLVTNEMLAAKDQFKKLEDNN